MMEYRSWVSTLSGHLFFHLSEPWNYRLDRIVGDIVHFNEKIGEERYIGISLLADLRDYNTKGKVKYTRIFFFGKTFLNEDKDGKNLKGSISFFSNGKNHIFEENEKNILRSLENLRKKLKSLTQVELEQKSKSLETKFKKLEQDILKYQQEDRSVYTRKMKFLLYSDGIIELGNQDRTSANFTCKADKTVFRQAYYFIKFMFHHHMHHIKSAEDIMRLTRIKDEDKKKFAFLMISDIKKYMVELRHSRKNLENLEGFAAYAKSLLNVLEKRSFINLETVQREERYFNNFIQSVNKYMVNGSNKFSITTLNNLLDTLLKIFVILMSLIAPYAIITSQTILKGSEEISDFLYNDILPLYINGFFILLIVVPMSDYIYHRKNSFIHRKWNMFKSVVGKFIKNCYKPTLKKDYVLLKRLIDLRQYLYHISFEKKQFSFYLKMLISFILLVFWFEYM
jgi:hypothetical protein